MAVKGRFAPSPSGQMHLGNLFSFLLAWLSVRHEGGSLVLRVEDLDPVRCQPAHAWQLMEDLEWLGLTWDEGGESPASWQSNRGHLYAEAFARLEGQGLTYPCFCSRIQRLNEAPHLHQVSPSCPCAALTAEEAAQRALERQPSFRVRVPHETISFTDALQGPYAQDLATQCGDFPIKRSDGAWAYQLAVVVDDADMGVTQVVRGSDLLSSTPRQMWLQDRLSLPHPAYGHLPLLLARDGRRLAKRDRDRELGQLQREYTARSLVGLLACAANLIDRPEPITPRELLPLFSWEKLPREDITI